VAEEAKPDNGGPGPGKVPPDVGTLDNEHNRPERVAPAAEGNSATARGRRRVRALRGWVVAWWHRVVGDRLALWCFGLGLVAVLFGGIVPDDFQQGIDPSVVLAVGLGAVVFALWRWLRLREEDRQNREARIVEAVGAGVLCVLGMAMFLIWLLGPRVQGLGAVGAVIAYVGLGRLLVSWREGRRLTLVRGPMVIGACALGSYIAWDLLDPTDALTQTEVRQGLLILIVSLLVAPIGATLLSEDLLRKVRNAPGNEEPANWSAWARGRRVVVTVATAVAVGGFLLAVLAIWPHAQEVFSRGVLVVAAVAVFGLVGLIAAKTQADIFVVVVVLLLLVAVAPDEVTGPPPPEDGQILVALGDSYMSGEGAKAFFTGTDAAGKNGCHRAPTAYPFRYTQEHIHQFPGGTVSFACSGAIVANLVHKSVGGVPQKGRFEPVGWSEDNKGLTQYEQLDRLLDSRGTDVGLILLSVGGNDAGFSTIGMTCVAPGSCNDQSELWLRNLRRNVRKSLEDGFTELTNTLAGHDLRIPVVVVPYPDPINERKCHDIALRQDEVDFVHTFLTDLNTRVHNAATAAGFHYLSSMETAMVADHLRLCDGGEQTGINFISAQSMNGSAEAQLNPGNWVHNSFHPNEAGHQAMETALETWIASNPDLTTPPPRTEPVDEAYLDVKAQCGLTADVDETGVQCKDAARLWALGEARTFVEAALPYAAGFLLAVWLLWLTEIARYRARTGPLRWVRSQIQNLASLGISRVTGRHRG
jgi:lysophospholipase L1-like esterase